MFGKKKNQKPEELHGYLSRLIAEEMEKRMQNTAKEDAEFL